ncbi:hypothetical protein ROS217_16945 [Roseovarius sp. 217]|nr:hypothetical protein ROS217_16945 [Roseovarius sp. 217]
MTDVARGSLVGGTDVVADVGFESEG